MKGTRFVMAIGMSIGLIVAAEAAMADYSSSNSSYSNADGHLNKGMQGCMLNINGMTFRNPGQMMRYIKDNPTIAGYPAGGNVHTWMDIWPRAQNMDVGEWLAEKCG
ncbi:hypothetical protein [Pelagovum sp. HNIBRBA483]|uniref:hypothetical protein n=1 Tax=Pelagovum sp. HNIBRBA483 TaxID=3233341 RepID=UPI0034A49CFE